VLAVDENKITGSAECNSCGLAELGYEIGDEEIYNQYNDSSKPSISFSMKIKPNVMIRVHYFAWNAQNARKGLIFLYPSQRETFGIPMIPLI
jgi:hypothetical protein